VNEAPGSARPGTDTHYVCLWQTLLARLDEWKSHWARESDRAALDHRIARRSSGAAFADAEIFQGLLLAVLSGNTRWSTIERIQDELSGPFNGFDLAHFAVTTPDEIERRLVPWFKERRAGSTGLKRGLLRLRETAQALVSYALKHGCADRYFTDALADQGGGPEDLAVAIGSSHRWKLPGFGIALAAEALRNIGFDVSKPDRHVTRCIGAWGLVDFRKWPEASAFTAPQASAAELHETMSTVRAIASANGLGASYASSVLWTAGALSGARLTNAEFRAIADRCAVRASTDA
jgi:hypothetical protein